MCGSQLVFMLYVIKIKLKIFRVYNIFVRTHSSVFMCWGVSPNLDVNQWFVLIITYYSILIFFWYKLVNYFRLLLHWLCPSSYFPSNLNPGFLQWAPRTKLRWKKMTTGIDSFISQHFTWIIFYVKLLLFQSLLLYLQLFLCFEIVFVSFFRK